MAVIANGVKQSFGLMQMALKGTDFYIELGNFSP